MDTMTYEQFWGLSMNVTRVSGRLTHAVLAALGAVNAENLSPSFFEPIATSRRQAEDMAFERNAAVTFARACSEKIAR